MEYEIKPNIKVIKSTFLSKKISETILGDFYAFSLPELSGVIYPQYAPKRGVVYIYTRKEPTITRKSAENIVCNIKSISKIEYKPDFSNRPKTDLVELRSLTPLVISPIAVTKDHEINLSPGPYPDIVSALIKFSRDFKIPEIEKIAAKGLVALGAYTHRRLKPTKIFKGFYGLKGSFVIRFYHEGIFLGEFLSKLPFVPLGEGLSDGFGICRAVTLSR